MNETEKERYLSIRMKGKRGGDTTEEEIDFLTRCRKEYPATCCELNEEINHRVMELMNPFYLRPDN